jgi:hypothetical protein
MSDDPAIEGVKRISTGGQKALRAKSSLKLQSCELRAGVDIPQRRHCNDAGDHQRVAVRD